MQLRLDGKVALVTGASGGLGRHFAQVLANAGAAVVLAARRIDAIEATRCSLVANGHRAVAVAMDVTDDAAVAAGFDAATRELGAPDIVVNNAGVSSTSAALTLGGEEWRRVVDTNLTGSFTVAREAATRLQRAGKGGSIVNIASVLGLRVAGGVAHYAAAKAGLVHLTKSLALEWARHGIRVNALAPGYFATDINAEFFATAAGAALVKRIPQRRLGQPSDLDGPLLLLASDASAYMTGAVLAVDGGHLVSSL